MKGRWPLLTRVVEWVAVSRTAVQNRPVNYLALTPIAALGPNPSKQARDRRIVLCAYNDAVREAGLRNPPEQIVERVRANQYEDLRLRITETAESYSWKVGKLKALERSVKERAVEALRLKKRADSAEAARLRRAALGKRSVAQRKKKHLKGRSPHVKVKEPSSDDEKEIEAGITYKA